MNVLQEVLNPDSFLDAVDSKEQPVGSLPSSLLIVRLTVAFREDDLDTAEQALARLNKLVRPPLAGYELCQATTASMWVAARRGSSEDFETALEHWLAGRRKFPEDWRSDVLEAAEFAGFLSAIDPQRLAGPPPSAPKERAITKSEREFVADLVESRLSAVEDNLATLRALGVESPASAIAKRYRLIAVDLGRAEARFSTKLDLPDLIVSLDGDGNYAGSSIAR